MGRVKWGRACRPSCGRVRTPRAAPLQKRRFGAEGVQAGMSAFCHPRQNSTATRSSTPTSPSSRNTRTEFQGATPTTSRPRWRWDWLRDAGAGSPRHARARTRAGESYRPRAGARGAARLPGHPADPRRGRRRRRLATGHMKRTRPRGSTLVRARGTDQLTAGLATTRRLARLSAPFSRPSCPSIAKGEGVNDQPNSPDLITEIPHPRRPPHAADRRSRWPRIR